MNVALRLSRPTGIGIALAAVSILNSVVSWLTWVKVGSSSRNSYEIFRTAQRFNLEALDPVRFIWFMSPVLTLGCLLLIPLRLRRSAGVLVLLQSFLGAGVSLAVLVVGIESGAGPKLGFASGLAGIGIGTASLLSLDSETRL